MNERQRLEQEALQYINKGNYDGALRAYTAILRLDPKDRRIRQRVGEIYIKIGRPQDAERHIREVAEGLAKENNHRAAVALFKMLVSIRPDDPAVQMELGDCYASAGYPNDARVHFDNALRMFLGTGKALQAAHAARRVADLSPGDPALRLRVAELLESGGDGLGAGAVYEEVVQEYRRRGRPDEAGRVAEMALRVRPDDLGLLLDASAARLDAQDAKKALTLLQTAFAVAPREPRTLDLLARAFESLGQGDKALKVLTELSRVAAERGDVPQEADALRRAARVLPDDPEVRARLQDAESRLSRLERRLTGLVLSQPSVEEELRAIVRAEVLARYGFHDRAETTLRAALESRRDSVPLRVALAEQFVSMKRVEEALGLMQAVLPLAGAESATVLDRMAVLRGAPVEPPRAPEAELPAAEAARPEARPEPRPEARPDARVARPAPVMRDRSRPESAKERGDRLAAAGDAQGAILAWREALQEDPLDDEVLGRIAALRNAQRQPEAAPPDEGTFAEISPDEINPISFEDPLEEARALLSVSQFQDALDLVSGVPGLEPRVVEAQARRGLGDVAGAVELLQRATNDAAETDAGYLDALFELSGLYAVTGKQRAALRLLEELREIDPDYRFQDVEARLRGIQRMVR